MSYITEEGEESIRQFKYKGGDASYSYKYVWSPLADYILNYVPTNWAPNAITVAGFLINGLGTIAITMQTPHQEPVIPWTLLFYAFCVFTYQTLDNIDGKQARKLKKSSPLGMMMDHGCDALGLIFLTAGVARVLCMTEETIYLWVFAFGVLFSFYYSAWCQYYSDGVMILGPVNAVDDGIPVIWTLAIVTFFTGQDIWKTEVTIGSYTGELNHYIAYAILLSGFGKCSLTQFKCGPSSKKLEIVSPKIM